HSAIVLIVTKRMAQMPGNGFTFAVRVTCPVYFLRFFGFLLQIFEKWTLAANGNVFRLVLVCLMYPRLTARLISNMLHRSYDFVSFTKVLFDGFGFGRRFDNNQIIRHFRLPPFSCLFKSK